MFQFPRCLPPQSGRCYGFTIAGFPIRTSPDHRLLSATRRLSQTTTSFFSCIYQGIPCVHFGELLYCPPFKGGGLALLPTWLKISSTLAWNLVVKMLSGQKKPTEGGRANQNKFLVKTRLLLVLFSTCSYLCNTFS